MSVTQVVEHTPQRNEGSPRRLFDRGRRRWYLTALGLALTLLATIQIGSSPGVYWARTTVVLLAPASRAFSNQLSNGAPSLIATAGVIEREINGSMSPIPAVDNSVTILDQGVVDGVRVRVPNYGGQWASNFTQPVLQLEVAGRSRAQVLARMDSLVEEARQILQNRQDLAGVNDLNRITLITAPAGTSVAHVQGHRTRAAVLTALLGLLMTAALVSSVDDLVRKRSLRREGLR